MSTFFLCIAIFAFCPIVAALSVEYVRVNKLRAKIGYGDEVTFYDFDVLKTGTVVDTDESHVIVVCDLTLHCVKYKDILFIK